MQLVASKFILSQLRSRQRMKIMRLSRAVSWVGSKWTTPYKRRSTSLKIRRLWKPQLPHLLPFPCSASKRSRLSQENPYLRPSSQDRRGRDRMRTCSDYKAVAPYWHDTRPTMKVSRTLSKRRMNLKPNIWWKSVTNQPAAITASRCSRTLARKHNRSTWPGKACSKSSKQRTMVTRIENE